MRIFSFLCFLDVIVCLPKRTKSCKLLCETKGLLVCFANLLTDVSSFQMQNQISCCRDPAAEVSICSMHIEVGVFNFVHADDSLSTVNLVWRIFLFLSSFLFFCSYPFIFTFFVIFTASWITLVLQANYFQPDV